MYIYKITNKINSKQYIGLYTKTVEESTNYYGSGKLIGKAIKKYGKDNFTKEILERDITDKKYLNDREIYWIAKYDTFNNGYNLTKGGQGNLGRVTSEETKRKIIASLKGYTHSEERRKKISEKAKGRVRGPHTEEFKKNLSEKLKGRKHSKETLKLMSDVKRKPAPRAEKPCPHCGRTLAKSHMTRWHGDKCKHRIETKK